MAYGYMAKIGADTSGLQTALKQINSSLRTTDNELFKVNSSIKSAEKAGTDSAELLKQKEEVLNNAINETSQKLERLKSIEEQVRSAANSGNISAENYRDYQREVANTEAQLRQYQNQLMQTQQTEQESAGANQMVVTSLTDVQNAYQKVAQDLQWFTDRLKNVADAALTYSERMAKYSLTVGQAFESSMSQVKAYSGAVGEDFEKLESAAKNAGATTSKSAKEAADALGYMALAGWDTQQMLDGLMPIVKASEAGTADLKRTSDLVTDSMSAMGVATSDLTHYLDICTAAQSNSNTTMTALLEAYVGCGGTLRNLNVPLEESATLLGTLANRGIKASEAGTSLNSILVNLMGANKSAREAMESLGVSAWDAQGNFIGVTNTLKLLDSALEGCTEQQKAFLEAKIGGKTQMDTLQALIAGVREEYNDLYTTLENSNGALMQTADTMHDNLAGALTSMNSALEALGNEFYDYLEEPAREAVDAVTDALRKLTSSVDKGELSAHLKELSDKLGDLMEKLVKFASEKGIDLLIDGLEKLIDALSWCADHFEQLVIAAEGLGAAFLTIKIGTLVTDIMVLVSTITTLEGAAAAGSVAAAALSTALNAIPFVAVAAAAVGAATALSSWIKSAGEAELEAASLKSELDKEYLAFTETTDAIKETSAEIDKNSEKIDKNCDKAKDLWEQLQDLCDEQGNVVGAYSDAQSVITELNELTGSHITLIGNQIQGYDDLCNSMDNYIETMRRTAKLESMHDSYVEAIGREDELRQNVEKAQEAEKTARVNRETAENAYKRGGTSAVFQSMGVDPNKLLLSDEWREFEYWYQAANNGYNPSPYNYDDYHEFLAFQEQLAANAASAARNAEKANNDIKKKHEDAATEKSQFDYKSENRNTTAEIQAQKGKAQSDKLNESEKNRKEEVLSRLTDLDGQKTVGDIDEETYYKEVGEIVTNEGYQKIFHSDTESKFWEYRDKYNSYIDRQKKTGGGSQQTDPEKEAEHARQKKESEASKAISDKKYELNYRKSTDYDYSDEQFYDDLETFAETLDKDTDAYTKLINEITLGRQKLAETAVNSLVSDYKSGDIGSLEELKEKIDSTVSEWKDKNIDVSKFADNAYSSVKSDADEKAAEEQRKKDEKAAEEQRKKDEKAAKEELEQLTNNYTDLLITEEAFQKQRLELKEKYAEKGVDIDEMYAEKEADIAKKRAENEEKLLREYTSGKLYSDVTEKGGKNRKVFDDLSKRTEEIRKYAADYAKLSQMKDVPPDLLAEIRTMDFDERRAVVAELMAMNEKNRSQYFSDYTAYHEAAKNAAEIETGVKFDADGFYVDSAAEAEKHGEADGNAYMLGFMRAAQNYSPEVDLTAMQSKHSFADLTGGHDPHGGFGTYISVNTPLRIEVAGVPVIETTVGKMLTDRGLIGRNNNNF